MPMERVAGRITPAYTVSMNIYAVLLCTAASLLCCRAESALPSIPSIIPSIIPTSIIHDVLPDCIFGVKDISFVLFTRESKSGLTVTFQNGTEYNCTDLPFQRGRQVIFVIHGFISEANTSSIYDLANTLMIKENVNVISVNWKEGACSVGGLSITDLLAYGDAVRNVYSVGEYVANFTRMLSESCDVDITKTIIIGHSLGAHVSSIAAKHLYQQTGKKPKEIIALDPAAPLFETKPCSERLCKSDANFVQVIHTSQLLGLRESLGHLDFYMSRGGPQPGCTGLLAFTCSHSRAVVYLTETVKHDPCFIGVPWRPGLLSPVVNNCETSTCCPVGFEAINCKANGTFEVKVKSTPPFCSDTSQN